MTIDYAMLPGRISAIGPLTLQQATLHTFCVDADHARIQAALDAMFARPSGGAVRYTAVGDKMFVSIAEIARASSLAEPDAGHGWSPEIDVTLWALAHVDGGGLLALRWVPVYLFVDNAPALVSGREIYGFPKQIGRFDFAPPVPRGGARAFAMAGWVLDPWSPATGARWAPLLAIEPVVAPPAPPRGLIGDLAQLASHAAERLAHALDPLEMAGMIAQTLGVGAVTMAFLKQFPDAADQTRACYQAVIEATATVTGFRGAGRTDDAYRLNLTSYDSHPFAREFGIATGWQDVGEGVWVDFDFVVEPGCEVWRATG